MKCDCVVSVRLALNFESAFLHMLSVPVMLILTWNVLVPTLPSGHDTQGKSTFFDAP